MENVLEKSVFIDGISQLSTFFFFLVYAAIDCIYFIESVFAIQSLIYLSLPSLHWSCIKLECMLTVGSRSQQIDSTEWFSS